jgi:hypothetical protein
MRIVIVETDTGDIDADMRHELLTWARALGLDTKQACTRFVLTEAPEGWWTAHFSLRRQRDGRNYVLPGADRLAVDYGTFVRNAPMNDWPRWFADPDEIPDMPIPELLEALDVAATARRHLSGVAYRRNRMEAYR